MSKIAINVAIVPPDNILDFCIEINKKAASEGKSSKYLGKDDYLPHNTLIMGTINEEDLPEITELIEEIALNTKQFEMTFEELKESNSSSKENLWMKVEKTAELQALHEKIATKLKQFITGDASVEMLHKGEETGMSGNTKKWLDTFIYNTANNNYKPHITLRCEKTEFDKLPIKFKAKKIVLFHAGDGCTCRKPIKEFFLKEN